MRWFQEFSQNSGNTSSDRFKISKQKPTLNNILANDCFWDVTGENAVIGGINSCYKFLLDGQCYFYYYKFYNKKRTDSLYRFEDTDIIVPAIWSVSGDTLLIARGNHYKILFFTRDSIIVEGNFKDTMVFRKIANQFLKHK